MLDNTIPFVEMKGITKFFTSVKANDNIDIDIRHGEILAILGENGAGKTTLMNILYGLYKPDTGRIFIDGAEVVIASPREAIQKGIGMVHQHFMLIPTHSIVENIILGMADNQGILHLRKVGAKVSKMAEEFGFQIEPYRKVKELPVGIQQRVEILKAIYRGAHLLIMDEPTAVLTPQETEDLFKLLKRFVQSGNAVVLITHKLNEVMGIADRVTVLRDGKYVRSVAKAATTEAELAQMMVGREIDLHIENQWQSGRSPRSETAKPLLLMEDVMLRDKNHHPVLDGLTLELYKGEILGIAGVSGNGQEELSAVLAGLMKAEKGRIYFNDQEITNRSSHEMIHQKISYIPADRQNEGLILSMSIRENLLLKSYDQSPFFKNGVLNRKGTVENANRLINLFNIKTPDGETLARNLSGGHQQKVVVARELSLEPELIIAFQPTRGLDIGAINYVHQLLLEARLAGKAVLLISTELSEIFNLSDRIGVIYRGKILKVMDTSETSIQEVGLLMAGVDTKDSL
ncbi:MAG TPA: heme ABC transporter ATP-binding protein [Firmicutes bacterium]|jgi:general nucleoside transport system ATP-binding protein|nr:heme ABC transporter ATP-binding protein [Bacillota bacterium]